MWILISWLLRSQLICIYTVFKTKYTLGLSMARKLFQLEHGIETSDAVIIATVANYELLHDDVYDMNSLDENGK